MILFPAIDLRGGQCVRLRQGDYDQETVFDADPVAVARRWVEQGASYLHLVDLDGAREGHPVNGAAVRRIVSSVSIPCQLGGGLRRQDDIQEVLSWGVARVILGTRAVQEPAWLEEMVHRYPQTIVLGLDTRQGQVATQGWLKDGDRQAIDIARQCRDWPLAALIHTDISRDGMLQGPNFGEIAALLDAVDLPVIASGGVTSLDDILELNRLGVHGCIIGRALYEGSLELKTALAALSTALQP